MLRLKPRRSPALVIFFLGLASCHPKTPRQPVDDWRLAPALRADRNGQVLAQFRSERVAEAIDPEDWIDLKSASGSAKVAELTVSSSCASAGKSAAQERSFRGVQSVQVRSLLPLLSVAATHAPDMPLTCEFRFQAINSLGSSHSFEFKNVTISPPKTSTGLELETGGQRLDPTLWRSNLLEAGALASVRMMPVEGDPDGVLSFICEKFSVQKRTSKPAEEVLEQFLRSEAARGLNGSPYPEARSEQFAAREIDLEQICRIVYVGGDRSLASPYFRYRLGKPNLQFSAKAVFEFPDMATRRLSSQGTIFRMTLQNLDPVARRVLLPQGDGSAMRVQSFLYGPYFRDVVYTISSTIHGRPIWRTSAPEEKSVSLGKVFRLEPRQTLTMQVQTEFWRLCTAAASNGVRAGFSSNPFPVSILRELSPHDDGVVLGQPVAKMPQGAFPFVAAPRNPVSWDISADMTDTMPPGTPQDVGCVGGPEGGMALPIPVPALQ